MTEIKIDLCQCGHEEEYHFDNNGRPTECDVMGCTCYKFRRPENWFRNEIAARQSTATVAS